MGVKITKIGNGVLFDMSEITESGASFPKKNFLPLTSIADIKLYDTKVVGYDISGDNWDMDILGNNASFPISEVGGVTPTSIDDLYDKLITLVSS